MEGTHPVDVSRGQRTPYFTQQYAAVDKKQLLIQGLGLATADVCMYYVQYVEVCCLSVERSLV